MDLLGLGPNIETTGASKRPPAYIRDRRLGTGASAQVFKVVEKYTGNVYAMKLYDKPHLARWQEAETLERLKHKHVVRYVAYNRTVGRPAELIMEYVKGPNLEEILDPSNIRQPLDIFEARDVIHQLLQAASHLHSKGVVHRDIKPANVIVARRGPVHIKLVDFGSATSAASFRSYWGTPWYTAPEHLEAQTRRTEKVDMYSVGVIALQLLFGATLDLPADSGPTSGLQDGLKPCIKAVLQWKESLASMSERFPTPFDFVCGLLAEKPDDRPSAMESLEHTFFRPEVDLCSCPGPNGIVPDLPTQVLETADGLGKFGRQQEQTGAEVNFNPYAYEAEQAAYAENDARWLEPYAFGVEGAGLIDLQATDYAQAQEAAFRSRSTGSRQSSSLRSRRKRHKQKHLRSFESGVSVFARSDAPSPQSQDHESAAAGDELYNDIKHSVPGAHQDSSSDTTEIPDTASCGSVREQWIVGSSHHSKGSSQQPSSSSENNHEVVQTEPVNATPKALKAPLNKTFTTRHSSDKSENKELYDDCWLDPLHSLGGGSFVKTIRGAAPRPPSEKTPNLQSFSVFGESGDLNRGFSDAREDCGEDTYAVDAQTERNAMPAAPQTAGQEMADEGNSYESLGHSFHASIGGPSLSEPPAAEVDEGEDGEEDHPETGVRKGKKRMVGPAYVRPSYQCEECSKDFARKCDYNKHIQRHKRPFVCTAQNCTSRGFTCHSDLRRHEREVHSMHGGPPKLLCPHPTCGRHRKAFSRQENLDSHLLRVHKMGGDAEGQQLGEGA
ncbi:Protein kinase-like domain protein [Niveomyces insectorum RCEF 264]|uniref:non-specific serine/threonine protein kinase n=1 Tax=Niveomyces insectorum RCEF 264 TaxID=1081102 RepID=A0A167XYJ6_9HYPO|nr:Protein kinase-like domain protein [Niveomyces insectorum RCEF 264]